MNEKEDLRIKKTKASLYRNMIELMKKKSLEEIKVSEICTKSKINRSTFYDHFKDKSGLVKALIEDTTKELEQDIKLETNVKTKDDYYRKIITKLIQHIDRNQTTYQTILKANHSSDLKEIMITTITHISQTEIKRLFPKEKETDNIVLFNISGIINLIIEELKNQDDFNKEKIKKTILKILSK